MSKIVLIIIVNAILLITGWIGWFHNKYIIAFICFILVIGISIGASSYMHDCDTKDTPSALDVYRGKTTLEITYRDSVAVDSVVVYKMK